MKTSFSTSLYMRYHPGPHSDNQVFHDFIQGPPSISFFFLLHTYTISFFRCLKISLFIEVCASVCNTHTCTYVHT